MFAARGLGVSLAIFFLLYLFASIVVLQTWEFAAKWLERGSARRRARWLFALRIFPFALALAFSLGVTLPSFLWLEPRQTGEEIGTAPFVLASCCVLVLALGIGRAFVAQKRTSRAIGKWLEGSSLLEGGSLGKGIPVPIFRTTRSSPTLIVAGISEPKVLVSEAAMFSLNAPELRRALQHEIAHVRSCDNLKKLLFRLLVFPGMWRLESVWSEAAEMAADDAAVSSRSEAIDLASALVKISRLAPVRQPELATSLLHTSTALSARVQRLCAWTAPETEIHGDWRYLAPCAMVAAACMAAIYSHVLVDVHWMTEWLVR